MPTFDRSRRYDSAAAFFHLNGDAVMKLTASAGIAVCEEAAGRGVAVVRIEGGIWYDPEFEAKLDCIWDGADPPMDETSARRNNAAAADFIHAKSGLCEVFIVTVAPLSGYERETGYEREK